MKKYGKIWAVLMALVLVFAMTACGGSGSSGNGTAPASASADKPSATEEATAALEKTLDALKTADVETLKKVGGKDLLGDTENSLGADDETVNQVLKALFGHMDYKIGEATQVDDNTVNIDVTFTNVDMSKAVTSLYTDLMSYALTHPDDVKDTEKCTSKAIGMLTDAVDKTAEKEDGTVEKEATVKMVKKDGEWQIAGGKDENTDLFNAMSGDFAEALGTITESLTPSAGDSAGE